MPGLIIHLFGSPHMEVGGKPVEVDTRKATALMAYLAVTGKTHQRDSLAALLWPDYDQSNARAALRRTLSTLNRALEGQTDQHYLEIARESIGMVKNADIWLDVWEFQKRLGALAAHGHGSAEVCPACLADLEAAAALYREPFMAGFNLRDSPNFEEWQFFQEETLQRDLSNALEKLVCGLAAYGRLEDAIQQARRWMALDPLLEQAHRQLMLLYSQANQRSAALRQYRECVRILDQELGVAPLEETTELYECILNRAPLPATVTNSEGRLRVLPETPNQPARKETAATDVIEMETVSVVEPAAPPRPLIGRARELAQITNLYASIQADGRMIALEGEAGIGKTRLAEVFLEQARQKGARILQARCYSGETGLAYAPFISSVGAALTPSDAARLASLPPAILAEVGRLLPEIPALAQQYADVRLPALLPASDGAQARFFEALRLCFQVLLEGPVPGVLFLDDLHWADTASLDLLTYLARRLRGMGILVLAAWRTEPGETIQALERLAGELVRSGQAARIGLKRLGRAEVAELVSTFPGANWSESNALGQRLYEESEGLPFIAVEFLSVLAAYEQAPENGSSKPWEMPASVRDLLRSRLAGIDAAAAQLLSTAAVIGRSFDLNTLRETSGRSEIETVDGLDQLLSAGLITEQPGSEQEEIRYDFMHEKLRALIYEETSLARRRLLHRRTAETLARSLSSRYEQPGLVAHHYEQAGLNAEAAEYHRLAGEQALRLFANVEAMAHFQAALAGGLADAVSLHEAIGDLQTLNGEYSAAITSYQTAAALCNPGCLANLEHKLGNVHQRLGEWELAESHFIASLEALGDMPESAFHVHLFADRSLTAHARGDTESAQAMAVHALDMAQSIQDPHALAQAYNVLGVLARASSEPDKAIACLEDSLRAAETLDDPLARIAALNNLALVYGENADQNRGNLEEAIRLGRQALDLCQKRGDRHREAALHNNLADLLHRSGREDEAMEQLKQAVVIFAEIGAPIEQAVPVGMGKAEIWKLTEW